MAITRFSDIAHLRPVIADLDLQRYYVVQGFGPLMDVDAANMFFKDIAHEDTDNFMFVTDRGIFQRPARAFPMRNEGGFRYSVEVEFGDGDTVELWPIIFVLVVAPPGENPQFVTYQGKING